MSRMFVILFAGCWLALGTSLNAQGPGVLPPTVFAIRGARVVVEPGKVFNQANVVIRNGIIEAVGPTAKIPPDALVMEGKGLTVYPGFIDAGSHWGMDAALQRSDLAIVQPADLASEALATTRADNRKGITPEFHAATALKADADRADAWRKQGFTAHLIAPEGGILAGQSALVSLSGAGTRETVLRAPVGQHVAFRASRGGDYPRALMGIVAHARQTILDAGHYRRVWDSFEHADMVGRRPPFDPSLASLTPALAGKQPVFFEADSADEIHRALDFADELSLKPILFGGRDAWKARGRLRASNVPIVLGLHIPGGSRNAEREKEYPQRVQEDHKREDTEQARNAFLLEQQLVRYAFATKGLPGDKPWEKFREAVRKMIDAGLPADAVLRALTRDAARILDVEKQLGTVEEGKSAHLVVMDGEFYEADTQVHYVFADGVRFAYDVKPRKTEPKKDEKKDEKKPDEPAKTTPAPMDKVASELDSDRKPTLQTGGNVLIRGATVLTITKGTLENTDILVAEGAIKAIGKDLDAPEGTKVIDARGMFVMPGIVDTHCHFAISGGVNEFSLSIVPEVRVRDVINSEDVQIYRGIAGGVTTSRLLHGSANVIGGQDAVIKMKYGEPAHSLLIADAPRGVKFALGENVKRTDGRFPNTRLGVEAVLIRAFTEAQEYQRTWEAYEKARSSGKQLVEPRRDLRLEALVGILKGEIKVHSHCYRADEILMLLRVANRFGIKVQSLQHVLEGYKIAPEIADHGASCSIFSDWWAYKIEAFDAIPYNAALLHEAGATVCMKSDSNELMRHLYQEAAKCVKYGGMSEVEALKTITLNPARQLGLDHRIGSIEVGKDADLAIFNGHPLNSYARVEMTLVEGEVYFQRAEKVTPSAVAQEAPSSTRFDFTPIDRSPRGRYIFRNVTVHPVARPAIQDAVVVVDGGKITLVAPAASVGKNIPNDAVMVDGKGLHLYPGMIDTATVLGLTELGSARETQDFAEGGDFQPDLRASVGVNPDSELIPVTRANGITTVVTRPMGSIVAGQSALINLSGWTPREMAVVDPLALQIEFPASLPTLTGDPTAPNISRIVAKKQRELKIRRLKELFQQANVYAEAKKLNPHYPANPRLEALVPYALGQKPIVIRANRKDEIVEALKLADEMKWKIILSGAVDAWKVADELKKRDIPVLFGPVMTMPQEQHDPYDAPFACPARLHEAGVRFCIRSTGSANTRNLPYEAAMAVSYGLPPDEALKAVTLYPAQILGVSDLVGSIEQGKRANLILTTGDPLQVGTQIVSLMIDGKPLEPTSKHTRLYERYRERLREVKEGLAPLGTK